MSTLTIDTLRLADGLKAAGAPAPQAEATARLLGEALADAIDPRAAARDQLESTIVDWRVEWRGEMTALRTEQQQTTSLLATAERRLDTSEQRLDKVEQRLDKVEQRLDKVEQRLGKVEQRLDKVEQRLDKVEQRLDKVEQRLDKVEQRLDKVEQRLDKVEQRLDKVEQALRAVELQLYGQSRDLGWLKLGQALVLASVLSLLAKAFV
jgi:chromosome segregation ATPase